MGRLNWTRETWRDLAETVALAGAIGYVAMIAQYVLGAGPEALDFGVFYRSLHAWQHGADPYGAGGADRLVLNLNPPVFVVLFGPLGQLPWTWAKACWYILNIVALAVSLRKAAKDLRLPVTRRGVLVCAAFAGTQAQLLLGQFSWVLLLPATLSWLAWRHRRQVAAGAWLGVLVGLKPIFGLLLGVGLLRRQWGVLGSALAVISTMVLVGGIGCGWAAYGSWLHAGAAAQPFALFYNASMLGIVHRLAGGGPPSTLAWVLACAVVVGVAATRLVKAPPDADRDLAVAYTTSLLVSPVGWVYYLALAFGPLLAVWREHGRRSRWASTGIVCLWFPIGLGWPPNGEQLRISAWNAGIGSLYGIGLLSLWVLTLAAGRRRAPSEESPNRRRYEEAPRLSA